MDAAQRLREWRGERKLREAALLLECDPSTVRYIEIRRNRPARKLANRIKDVVGIDATLWDEVELAPKSSPESDSAAADDDSSPEVAS